MESEQNSSAQPSNAKPKKGYYKCAHCGASSYSPLKKAMAGNMSSEGAKCPSCGKRCVNGKLNLAVNSIVLCIAFVMIIITYFTYKTKMDIVFFGVIPLIAALIINFVFNMFFGKLIGAVKRSQNSRYD